MNVNDWLGSVHQLVVKIIRNLYNKVCCNVFSKGYLNLRNIFWSHSWYIQVKLNKNVSIEWNTYYAWQTNIVSSFILIMARRTYFSWNNIRNATHFFVCVAYGGIGFLYIHQPLLKVNSITWCNELSIIFCVINVPPIRLLNLLVYLFGSWMPSLKPIS